MLKIIANDINFLIYQYLEETGYKHTAFTFHQESRIPEDILNNTSIPPGMLLMYLEKALLLLQMETHLDKDEEVITCNQPFTLLNPHVCKPARFNVGSHMQDIRSSRMVQEKMEESEGREVEERKQTKIDEVKGIRLLKEHKGEVYNLAWHPNKRILVSGGSDGTARLWTGETPEAEGIALKEFNILPHVNPELKAQNSESKAEIVVTALDWSAKLGLLATGGNDGVTRIWNDKGNFLIQPRRNHYSTQGG
jgi:transducin (beta)-like 1